MTKYIELDNCNFNDFVNDVKANNVDPCDEDDLEKYFYDEMVEFDPDEVGRLKKIIARQADTIKELVGE